MTKYAEIFRAPNNDGTGREDWHVALTEDGEPAGVYGGFHKLTTARACARAHDAIIRGGELSHDR